MELPDRTTRVYPGRTSQTPLLANLARISHAAIAEMSPNPKLTLISRMPVLLDEITSPQFSQSDCSRYCFMS